MVNMLLTTPNHQQIITFFIDHIFLLLFCLKSIYRCIIADVHVSSWLIIGLFSFSWFLNSQYHLIINI